MRTRLLPPLLLLLSLSVCAVGVRAQARDQAAPQTNASPLDNASVVKLVRAGFSEKTVIAIIRTRPARFDLAPDRLIELKKRGVSEKIILAMLAHDSGALVADDEPGAGFDDPIFHDPDKQPPTAGTPTDKGDPGETNIFGSSGGV